MWYSIFYAILQLIESSTVGMAKTNSKPLLYEVFGIIIWE